MSGVWEICNMSVNNPMELWEDHASGPCCFGVSVASSAPGLLMAIYSHAKKLNMNMDWQSVCLKREIFLST